MCQIKIKVRIKCKKQIKIEIERVKRGWKRLKKRLEIIRIDQKALLSKQQTILKKRHPRTTNLNIVL